MLGETTLLTGLQSDMRQRVRGAIREYVADIDTDIPAREAVLRAGHARRSGRAGASDRQGRPLLRGGVHGAAPGAAPLGDNTGGNRVENETMTLLGQLASIATPVALVAGWLRIEKKIRDECAMVRREAEKAHVQIGERIGRLDKTVDGLTTEIGNVKHALGRLEGASGRCGDREAVSRKSG